MADVGTRSKMKTLIFKGDTGAIVQLETLRYQLAIYMSKRNSERSKYVPDIEFGDASWDILLDIFTAEYLDRSTSVKDIAGRLGMSEPLCGRYVNYLLSKAKLFKNTNKYTADAMPVLISDSTKNGITAWLDDCIANSPSV
ncbi:MAG: hypothetical protein AB8B54_07800 [Sphingorhabdus sp.]